MSDPELLAAVRRLEEAVERQNKTFSKGFAEIGSSLYFTGVLLSLGMNWSIKGNLFAALLSWLNVGYLIMEGTGLRIA
ncbi:MAG TPA: hypothetical protein VD929_02540 [Caulobacteraceae bacterium]|nr:hypothetical protein [Caulobacteraceae bacterium]